MPQTVGAAGPRTGEAGDPQIAEDDTVAVVDQQVEPPYGPVEDGAGGRRGGARHAEGVGDFQGVRGADRDDGQNARGELPFPVEEAHRTQQRTVVAEHHGAA